MTQTAPRPIDEKPWPVDLLDLLGRQPAGLAVTVADDELSDEQTAQVLDEYMLDDMAWLRRYSPGGMDPERIRTQLGVPRA